MASYWEKERKPIEVGSWLNVRDAFVLQDDNARPHRARMMNAYLEQETIHRMHWLIRSLKHNLIQHVWDALGRRVAAFNPLPRTSTSVGKGNVTLPSYSIDRPHN
ncbi:transposable element Tc1 transposase [Trichonephila clavipes]|nr:transposable element Tc1 transposase [Trichonephila clavipes]